MAGIGGIDWGLCYKWRGSLEEGNKDGKNGMEIEERIEWPCVSEWKIQRISPHCSLERLSSLISSCVRCQKLLVSP